MNEDGSVDIRAVVEIPQGIPICVGTRYLLHMEYFLPGWQPGLDPDNQFL